MGILDTIDWIIPRLKPLRTYTPGRDDELQVASAWLRTLASKARRTKPHTAAGWAYRALEARLGVLQSRALLEGEYDELEQGLAELSGSPEVQV